MRALFIFLLVPFLILGGSGAAAAQISLSLVLDRDQISMAESVRVVVSLAGQREADSRPVIQGADDFAITPGGTSSRMEIINGQVNSRIEFSYFLQPKKTGSFTLGPATVKVGGKVYSSNQASLEVTKTSAQPGAGDAPLYLQTELDSPRLYPEQTGIYILKLYRRVPVRDLALNLPELDGLTFRQLTKPKDYQAKLGGRAYQVLEVRYALNTSKPGVYALPPAKLRLTVVDQGPQSSFGGFFNDPFFSAGRPVTLASQALELRVLPFPHENKPAGFSGLVGEFQIDSKLEPNRLKAGESATLTVKVSGRGNLQRVPDLALPELAGVKVYADQPALQAAWDSKGQSGVKVMKWALVPDKKGAVHIPLLNLVYFHPQSGTYKSISSRAYELTALPLGKPDKAPELVKTKPSNGPKKQEIKELGSDILPIHGSLQDLSAPPLAEFPQWSHWLAMAAPVLFYLAALLLLRVTRRSPQALSQSRAKKAAKQMQASCSDPELSNAALINQLKDYFNRKFGLSLGVLTAQEAGKVLQGQGCAHKTIERAQACILSLENAVYSGRGDACTELSAEVSRLVKEIERETR